jgi:DNA polymerase-3 subunit beta
MKVKVNLKEFQEALKKVERGINNKNSLPILLNIKLETSNNEIKLYSTDLGIFIKVAVPANIIEPGAVLLNQKTVKLIYKLKNHEITITDDSITAGNRVIEFRVDNLVDFPEPPQDLNIKYCEITESELKNLLEVKYAAGIDATGSVINSIVIDNNRFVALDGYRLAIREGKFNSELNKVPVSIKSMLILDKLLDDKSNNIFEIYSDERVNDVNNRQWILFKSNNLEVYCTLLQDKYLNYESYLPKEHKTKIVINNTKLLKELNFINEVAKELEYKPVEFNVTNNKLKLKVKDENNILTSELDIIGFEGEGVRIYMNCQYWIDMLKNTDEKIFIVKFRDTLDSVLITNEKETEINLIYPIKINK